MTRDQALTPALAAGGHGFAAFDLWQGYGDQPVLRGAHAEFPLGAVSAIVGANGAGKSTLFRVLAGEVAPDRGYVALGGRPLDLRKPGAAARAGIRFMHQFPQLVPEAKVWEHLSEGSFEGRRWFTDRRGGILAARRALDRFEVAIDPELRIADLDQDGRQLVEICRAFIGDPDVVLLDEPTVGLTPARRAQLYDWLRAYARRPAAVVIISHDHKGLLQNADLVFELAKGKVAKPVPIAEAVARLEQETALDVRPVTYRLARNSAIEVESVEAEANTDPSSQAWSFRDIDYFDQRHAGFTIPAGSIVGLCGPATSWSGQLLRMSVGLAERGTCRLYRGALPMPLDIHALARRGVAYISRERGAEWGYPGLPLDFNLLITEWQRRLTVTWRTEFGDPRATLARFRVVPADPEAEFAQLSGGNQQKLVIGRHLLAHPQLLLIDEPFSGIDQDTRIYLGKLLRDYVEAEGATIVIHSQEADDLAKYCGMVVEVV